MKLRDFKLATSDDLSHAGYGGAGIFTWSPGGINATVIRKVLHDTFGPANGYPGEKSSWEWAINTDNGLLAIYDYKGGWSIGYRGSGIELTKTLEKDASKLRSALLEEAAKVKVSKKQIREGKIGGVITNPYSLFRNTTNRLLSEANKVISEIEVIKKKREGLTYLVNSLNRASDIAALYRSAFLMSFLSLEGFINVIYLLFLNNRYKNEFFERKLQSEMIPTKLLEIDKYCNDFPSSVITMDHELFKAFQHLTNVRNDFVHANIISEMQSHLVKVGPHHLITEDKKERKFGITTHPGRINNVDVVRAQRLVEKIVAKVISSMNDRIRYQFAIVHGYTKIPYLINEDDNILIPLTEDDFVPKEEIEKILDVSFDLDEAYYAVDQAEFETPDAFFY